MPSILRRFAPQLLVFSAASTLLWWLALWLFPSFRVLFLPNGAPEWVLWSFFVPDIFLLVTLPITVARLLRLSSKHAWPLLCVYCGGVIYATLLTVALCTWSRSAWLGALAMLSLSVFTMLLTLSVRPTYSK